MMATKRKRIKSWQWWLDIAKEASMRAEDMEFDEFTAFMLGEWMGDRDDAITFATILEAAIEAELERKLKRRIIVRVDIPPFDTHPCLIVTAVDKQTGKCITANLDAETIAVAYEFPGEFWALSELNEFADGVVKDLAKLAKEALGLEVSKNA